MRNIEFDNQALQVRKQGPVPRYRYMCIYIAHGPNQHIKSLIRYEATDCGYMPG